MHPVEMDYGDVRPQVVGISSAFGFRPSRNTATCDADGYVVEQMPLSASELRWAFSLAVVSFFDLFASGDIMYQAFAHAYLDNGVTLYCMGVQSLSHLLSSIVLVVRFADEGWMRRVSESTAAYSSFLREQRKGHLLREQCLSVIMGITMMTTSGALLFKALRKVKYWDRWYTDHVSMDRDAQETMEFLAWWGFGLYVVQAILRFVAGRGLNRSMVWHGFVVSLVSCLFLLAMGIAASYEKEWSWKAEPIAAVFLVGVTLIEGVRVLIMNIDDMENRLESDPRA